MTKFQAFNNVKVVEEFLYYIPSKRGELAVLANLIIFTDIFDGIPNVSFFSLCLGRCEKLGIPIQAIQREIQSIQREISIQRRKNEILSENEPRIRDMDDMNLDQFINLHVQRTQKATSTQTHYNKFKRVLMIQPQWRDFSCFKKAVQSLVVKHWSSSKGAIEYHLKKYHIAFAKGNITIRPLINYPNHIGVYATKDIKSNETIIGLEALISTKPICSDSKVIIDTKSHSHHGNHTVLDGPLFFVNHSDNPNLDWIIPAKTKKYKQIVYKARSIRPIKAGKQLFLNYGDGYFENDTKIADYY
ncbi:hypothetical protein BC833DRAFT_417073 [Globomyces pollinis-pini]|nr:hypothetical protein BC833DRAFT_417073 [Globomyces pollinis-pini]